MREWISTSMFSSDTCQRCTRESLLPWLQMMFYWTLLFPSFTLCSLTVCVPLPSAFPLSVLLPHLEWIIICSRPSTSWQTWQITANQINPLLLTCTHTDLIRFYVGVAAALKLLLQQWKDKICPGYPAENKPSFWSCLLLLRYQSEHRHCVFGLNKSIYPLDWCTLPIQIMHLKSLSIYCRWFCLLYINL